ncbi:hypothetical protein CRENBAI_016545 [Crenichthys baileyi]|uniref:Uncharacterized protein n=1 Tax=Crenichthys baileyi TaxID=28760 RepID=A0AAV9S6U9_9TELE
MLRRVHQHKKHAGHRHPQMLTCSQLSPNWTDMRTVRLRFHRERCVLTGDAHLGRLYGKPARLQKPSTSGRTERKLQGRRSPATKTRPSGVRVDSVDSEAVATRERPAREGGVRENPSATARPGRLPDPANLQHAHTQCLMNAPRAHGQSPPTPRSSAQTHPGQRADSPAVSLFTPDDPLPPRLLQRLNPLRQPEKGMRNCGLVILTGVGRAGGSTGPLTSGGSRLRLPDTEGVSQAARGLLTATKPAESRLESPDPASGAHREPPWRTPSMPLLGTEFRTDGFPGGSLLSGHVAALRHRPGFPLHTAPQQGSSSRAEFRGGARRAEASAGPNNQEKRFPSAPREGILH